MASSARHLFLLAFVAALAVTTPRAGAWGGGRLFFSKTTRPTVDEPEKVSAAGTTAVPADDAADPSSGATAAFSRPSTGGSGRGYGLYGRPEDSFPPGYFRRGVHRNADKLTTTGTANEAAVPVGGRAEERAEPLLAEDNGSGRGRAPWTNANNNVAPATTGGSTDTEETSAEEDNGSGWGRPRRYYRPAAADGTPEEEQRRGYYGMSDTRLYQNGRYYYDVDAGRYGYGRESNPVRTGPEEFAVAGAGRGRYGGNAAAGYQQYGNGNELGNNGFQEEARNGRYVP